MRKWLALVCLAGIAILICNKDSDPNKQSYNEESQANSWGIFGLYSSPYYNSYYGRYNQNVYTNNCAASYRYYQSACQPMQSYGSCQPMQYAPPTNYYPQYRPVNPYGYYPRYGYGARAFYPY